MNVSGTVKQAPGRIRRSLDGESSTAPSPLRALGRWEPTRAGALVRGHPIPYQSRGHSSTPGASVSESSDQCAAMGKRCAEECTRLCEATKDADCEEHPYSGCRLDVFCWCDACGIYDENWCPRFSGFGAGLSPPGLPLQRRLPRPFPAPVPIFRRRSLVPGPFRRRSARCASCTSPGPRGLPVR